MEMRINEDELKLLAFFHDTAAGYDWKHCIEDDNKVLTGAEIDEPAAIRAATYLTGWGLLAVADQYRTRGNRFGPLYLTHFGEAYMREVDERLAEKSLMQRGKRIGVGLLATIKDEAVKLAVQAFDEYAKRTMGGR